jgi:hypothetical protein
MPPDIHIHQPGCFREHPQFFCMKRRFDGDRSVVHGRGTPPEQPPRRWHKKVRQWMPFQIADNYRAPRYGTETS